MLVTLLFMSPFFLYFILQCELSSHSLCCYTEAYSAPRQYACACCLLCVNLLDRRVLKITMSLSMKRKSQAAGINLLGNIV